MAVTGCAACARRMVFALASLDQVLHRAGDVLDRHGGIDPVLVEEVDGLDLETLERALNSLLDMHWTTVEAVPTAVRVDPESELGGDHHPVPEGCEGLTDELLVGEGAVDLGGVEERDAELDGGADDLDSFLSIGWRTVHPGAARVHPEPSHHHSNLIASGLLTRTISMIMLILEEARRVFADLRREVSQMDMIALTFVALLLLMLVFFAWWGETRQPGLPG